MVLELKDENFENEVLKSSIPVIVDFWAEWCGPCRMMGPVFEELSKDYDGKLKFVKANVDACQKIAVEYEIMSIPCLVMFKAGTEHKRFVGFKQKAKLKEEIDAALN
jgi:thioredoxin 1